MPAAIETPNDVFLGERTASKSETFHPLGFPVVLATNSEPVMAAARQSWGPFPVAHQETPVSLCLTVTEDGDEPLPRPPKFRTHGHLMSIVADARNQVICDFSRGYAVGWVTRRVAAETGFLRFHFLEAPAMIMLVAAHLAPVHGGLVTRGGLGLILCGDSLAGKSTLAYACARRGWTFVSDDGAFLLRNRAGLYAVGDPYRARFREHAKLLFPELEKCGARAKPSGAPGIEVPMSELPVAMANGCSIHHVVFLRRSQSGPARIERFDPARALAWLEREVLYGTGDVQASQRETYRRLLEAGLWELHYTNLSEAVDLLEQL